MERRSFMVEADKCDEGGYRYGDEHGLSVYEVLVIALLQKNHILPEEQRRVDLDFFSEDKVDGTKHKLRFAYSIRKNVSKKA